MADTNITPEQARAEWAAALRSGEYKQGTGLLHKIMLIFEPEGDTREEEQHCCLGVACDIAVKHGVIEPPQFDGLAKAWCYADDLEATNTHLPRKVAQFFGVAQSPVRKSDHAPLTDLNDIGTSFDEIADAIEQDDLTMLD